MLRHSKPGILVWPALCLLTTLLLWTVTLSKLRSDQEALQFNAERQARTLAKTYAEQLARSVEQLDQITVSLKYYWQKSNGKLSLADQMRHGLFPNSRYIYISVFDRNGALVASTFDNGRSVNYADREWFRRCRRDTSDALMIITPDDATRLEKNVIRFARRLTSRDGAFDGAVSVAVDPAYLASFTDPASLGKGDFVAVSRMDGLLLASKTSESAHMPSTVFRAPLVPKMAAGVALFGQEHFVDGLPRITAWQVLDDYPLVSVVGMSEQGLLAASDLIRHDYLDLAFAGSAFLLLAALTGVFFSARLAWRKQQADELRNAYHLAIDGAREGFYTVRAIYGATGGIIDFLVEDCNERGAVFLGRTKEQTIGAKFSQLFSGSYADFILNTFRDAMELGFLEIEYKVPPESPVRAAWVHRKLVRSGNGLAMTMRDISDAKRHEQALADMVNTDALTMLPNRHWLMNALPVMLERARKSGNASVALLFIDLDDFKNINDTLGHAAGDELLQAAAARLRLVIRPHDSVARLGGDEFTVVLDQVRSHDDVRRVAERVIQALDEPFLLAGGGNYTVRGSVGVSLYPQDGDDAKTLLKHADIAMYAAKAEGKGQYQLFRPQLSESLVRRFNKEQALRRAIERDEFVLYYQPRVDTFSGELRGLEALVRWMPPEGGLVPPLEFIPLAEDTGLIARLGERVIDKACAQLAQWQAQGLTAVPVSINVSPRQFSQSDVSALLAARMAQHGIAPALVEVEITESSMMGESDAVTRQLAAIEAMGIKLLIDDFGTGYSSLSQLQHLRFDVLKIDRAFTARLCSSREGEAFFMAILSMAHVLGMRVVAEGVETTEQLRVLQALSCNEVQGYLVARPLPAAEIPALLIRRFLLAPVEASLSILS